MHPEDLDGYRAQDAADATLAHCAQQYTVIVGMLHRGDGDRVQFLAATQRLQDAAAAWCASRRHTGAL